MADEVKTADPKVITPCSFLLNSYSYGKVGETISLVFKDKKYNRR